jgi:hypothetical protein
MLTLQLRRERGQAIVLLVFALIGLLGFAAVALDGGNIYAEQRRAQAAADNAVLAAAYQYMTGVKTTSALSTTALANAAVNAYDNDGIGNKVTFHRPPLTGAYAGNSSYMQVIITETVPTALAHLVYKGPFQLTVSAVGYARYGGPPVDGAAIVAMDPDGCGIVTVNGGGTNDLSLSTTGGGIFANSDGYDAEGHPTCTGSNSVLDAQSSHAYISSDHTISIVATENAYDENVSPQPITGVPPLPGDPLADLDVPTCASGPNTTPSSGTINPGTYNGLDATGSLTLNPGLYCIVGTGTNVIDSGPSGSITGNGVMLYVPYGEVNLQQGTIRLRAPSDTYNPECVSTPSLKDSNASACHYRGIVFFLGRTNTLGIKLTGNSDWVVEGTIYNPNGAVTLGGNGGWTLTGQILSKNVVASGNGIISVFFDPSTVYKPDPAISLVQ